ncbi:chemotaxis protein CheW [Caldicellulosiruptoraceae bacterium PP1]
MEQYLIFKLSTEYYGISIEYLESIERLMPITRVPKAKTFVKGVINLRGEIVPVIDLRERLNTEMKEFDDDTRIIIINYKNNTKVGMIIDEIHDVVFLNKEDIDPVSKDKNEFQFLVAKYNDLLINLINIDEILFDKKEEV